GADVTEQRAADRLEVDPAVAVETAVLDCDRRLLHPRADLGQRHRLAVLLGRNRPEHRSVGGVDEAVLTERRGLELVQRAVVPDRGCAAEPDRDRRHGSADDQEAEDREPAAAACLLPPALAAAVGELGSSVRPVARAVGRRAHSTPCSRSRRWARTRRSLSRSSAATASGAQARTVTVASPFRLVTSTSARGSPAVSLRSRSTTASRSLSSGTCTVTSASFSGLTMVEFTMVSEASFSLGITRRALSAVRMNV